MTGRRWQQTHQCVRAHLMWLLQVNATMTENNNTPRTCTNMSWLCDCHKCAKWLQIAIAHFHKSSCVAERDTSSIVVPNLNAIQSTIVAVNVATLKYGELQAAACKTTSVIADVSHQQDNKNLREMAILAFQKLITARNLMFEYRHLFRRLDQTYPVNVKVSVAALKKGISSFPLCAENCVCGGKRSFTVQTWAYYLHTCRF